MPQFVHVEQLSLALLLLTAILFAYASYGEATRSKRIAPWLAMLAMAGAINFMMRAYSGKTELVFDQSSPAEAVLNDDGDGAGSTLGGRLAALVSGNQRQQQQPAETIQDCPECPVLVTVKPAYFRMGASPGDADAHWTERPARVVRISQSFGIGRMEVTVGQYMAFVKATARPLPVCGSSIALDDPRLPVSCVTWRDAVAYVRWLGAKTGKAYRLPTESEWEYAARGGAPTRYATGNDIGPEHANIGQRGASTVPAGSFPANGFGLQDIHGGVAELMADCWSDTLRSVPGESVRSNRRGDCSRSVLRDAGATEAVVLSRLSARRPIDISAKQPNVGFRVMRDLEKHER